MGLVTITEFSAAGWGAPERAAQLAREYCERLEEGDILFFSHPPFPLPAEDQAFLLEVRQTASAVHKNIAYKPDRDRVQGYTKGSGDSEALRRIMQSYSRSVSAFLDSFLLPYAGRWQLDFASYRSVEEQGRDLPISKRNDLLHVDSFPTRPSNGNRILRVFTNLNPERPRVWLTGEPFDALVRAYGADAGVSRLASRARSPFHRMVRRGARAARAIGLPVPRRPLYDEFMLGFHHYLKYNRAFQESCPKSKWEFPPNSTWLVFTDLVPHAVLSGQYAIEQTFLVSRDALLLPEKAPCRVLEKMVNAPVVE
ncbi:MAG: Kdo hydroxylase family protein [Terriglobia bacterium]